MRLLAKQGPVPTDIPMAGPLGIEPSSEVLEASLRPSLEPIVVTPSRVEVYLQSTSLLGYTAPRSGYDPLSLAGQASRDTSRVTRH